MFCTYQLKIGLFRIYIIKTILTIFFSIFTKTICAFYSENIVKISISKICLFFLSYTCHFVSTASTTLHTATAT